MNRPSIVCIKKKQAEWNDRALPVFQKLAECYILLSRKITAQNVTCFHVSFISWICFYEMFDNELLQNCLL